LIWIVGLAVLGALLYVTFWLAALLVFGLVVAAWLARDAGHDGATGEWSNGPEGYGYYEDGVRTDYGRIFEDGRG